MTGKGVGKGGKYDYDQLRIDCLRYLYHERQKPSNRTMSKLMKHLGLQHSASFNRVIYFLIGAGLVEEDMIGSTWLFTLTDKGILYLEKLQETQET